RRPSRARGIGAANRVADEDRGGIAHAERNHERKRSEVDGDLVAGHLGRPQPAHHQSYAGEGPELEHVLEADRQPEPEHPAEGSELPDFRTTLPQVRTQIAPREPNEKRREQPPAGGGGPRGSEYAEGRHGT